MFETMNRSMPEVRLLVVIEMCEEKNKQKIAEHKIGGKYVFFCATVCSLNIVTVATT